MNTPAWLTARPIAHRGLHDAARDIIENSMSAAKAAIVGGFAIECDVQMTSDGEVVVFHDHGLHRLTGARAEIDASSASFVASLRLGASLDGIPTLTDFVAFIAGRVPLVCEIKSRFDGDLRLAEAAGRILGGYAGPACLESFDPLIMAHLRSHRADLGLDHVPLGMVAMANYDGPGDEWAHLATDEKRSLANFLHYDDTRPEFLSYGLRDLPSATAHLCRAGLGLPVTVWTVRSLDDARHALTWGDQIVFEGDGGLDAALRA